MSLDEALTFARGSQPTLLGALARVNAAAADQRVARAAWTPRIGATLQAFEGTTNNTTASTLGVAMVALPRIGGTRVDGSRSWAPSRSTLAAVGLEQEIFDFGRIAAAAAVTDVAFQVERHRADAERLRIELMVKEAYFGVHGARSVLRAAEDAFKRAALHRDMASAEVKSGLFAPIELTRAESDLARFDVGQIRARGALSTAQAVFAAAVGVTERLLDAKDAVTELVPPPPVDEGIRRALHDDPIILESLARIEGAQALTRELGAELRPQVVLTSSVSERGASATPSTGPYADPYEPLPSIPNWDVGLLLTWPLHDGVVEARRNAAASRVAVARADAVALAQEEVAAVEHAYVSLAVSQAALVGLERAVHAALANYAQAEARFKAGLGTALELADAESLRTDAEIQLAVGEFDARRYRAVIGRLLAEDS